MATASQVKALIQTHAEGDAERFYAIAMQVAAREARQGHTNFAQELRDLVDEARKRAKEPPAELQARPVSIVQPRGELAGDTDRDGSWRAGRSGRGRELRRRTE